MSDKFFKYDTELTEQQTSELVDILGKRCRPRTKARLESILKYDLQTVIKELYSMSRFYVDANGEVHYCAGQSYPCEIKAIRNFIMKRWP